MTSCEQTLMDDFDINSFKQVILNVIAENNEIISKLDKDYIDCGGDLLYKKIFPFFQNPETIETDEPFICVRVSHVGNVNTYLERISVEINVTCHEKGMGKKVTDYKTGKVLSGTVIDLIGEDIKKCLSGLDSAWIGKLRCRENVETVIYYKYPTRSLVFIAEKEAYGNH